jgi:PAS domain S-box-containing protein
VFELRGADLRPRINKAGILIFRKLLVGAGKQTRNVRIGEKVDDSGVGSIPSLLIRGVVDYAIYMLDPEGRVMSWNTGAERIKGYAAEEIIGQHFSCFYTEEDRARYLPERVLKAAVESGHYTAEAWRCRKDGSRFWASVVINPVHEEGKLVGFAKVTRDLTEQRAMEIALRDERANAILREQFIAVLGHDLRNPLAAMLSGTRLLMKMSLNDRAAAIVRMMEDSGQRMSGLIDNVLDFARGRLGGGLVLDPAANAPVEMALRQVVAELTASAPDRVVEMEFNLAEPINCDLGRIAQLCSNLLGNAHTHGSADQPIHVRAVSGPGCFELSVSNAGDPIPPVALGRLFRPFFRSAGRSSREGLGLGLYIAHEIAKAHGGTLGVESTRDETRFTFRMPTGAQL